jgi:zeta-carotene isomerase
MAMMTSRRLAPPLLPLILLTHTMMTTMAMMLLLVSSRVAVVIAFDIPGHHRRIIPVASSSRLLQQRRWSPSSFAPAPPSTYSSYSSSSRLRSMMEEEEDPSSPPSSSTVVAYDNNNPLLSLVTKSRTSNRANDIMVGEDSGLFDVDDEKWGSLSDGTGWITFLVAVGAILSAVAVLWINPSTGYGDDLIRYLEVDVAGGNSHLVTLAFGIIFPVVHSGLASLRPYGEKIVGARAWRVIFAFPSLCLAYSWIVYFISHAHDGYQFYDVSSVPWVHGIAWLVNFTSFLFLYPSVYNLKEVAAVEKPKVHLWETGVIRITRHPQYVGQVMWSAAHLAMIGTSFTALTMALLVGHHYFACWNGDRRLEAEHGDNFARIRDKTSIMPFRAVWEGRQILPDDYWKELLRPPLLLIAVGSAGAYIAHPYMQAGAALSTNAGWVPGGLFS